MKKKSLIVCMSALFLAMTISLSNAYAHHGRYESAHGGDGLDNMFFMKAHFIKENHAELEIPEDKLETIKNLELETKKMLIKQDAEIETVCLDIMSKLHDYPVDVDAVNKLVDQKYELKKAEAKSLVDAIYKLKGSLTKDQYDKMHKLWESGEGKEYTESN